jgi:hypothetical protein
MVYHYINVCFHPFCIGRSTYWYCRYRTNAFVLNSFQKLQSSTTDLDYLFIRHTFKINISSMHVCLSQCPITKACEIRPAHSSFTPPVHSFWTYRSTVSKLSLEVYLQNMSKFISSVTVDYRSCSSVQHDLVLVDLPFEVVYIRLSSFVSNVPVT